MTLLPGVTRLVVGPLETNCYVLSSPTASSALVVDPGDDGARIARELHDRSLRLGAVLLTHAHIDHVAGLPDVLRDAGPAPVYLHEGDLPLWDHMAAQAEFLGVPTPRLPGAPLPLSHGQVFAHGGFTLEVIHGPGHSPGSVFVLVRGEAVVLSGDTVFREGVGRTDLWGGSSEALLATLQRILTLPDDKLLLPGHGEPTTLGQFRAWASSVCLFETLATQADAAFEF